jgi:fibronectin type 3 domain-containing protein
MSKGLATTIVCLAGITFGADAPTGLSVAQIDYTQAACNIDCSARLSWTAPAGSPTGYNVYRRIAANENPTLAGTVAAPATTFTDTAATVGQSYLYTVTAVDAGVESA